MEYIWRTISEIKKYITEIGNGAYGSEITKLGRIYKKNLNFLNLLFINLARVLMGSRCDVLATYS